MLSVLKETFIRFEEDIPVIRAELAADIVSELPVGGALDGTRLEQGSIAWVISEGALYGMDSHGVWIGQGGSSSESASGKETENV